MPFTERDGVRLYWKLDGKADAPPLVLLHSIGTDMGLWDGMVRNLATAFRCLRLDLRGHGASDAPGGDYSLAMLAADVAAMMAAAGIDDAAVAGVSLGGMVAMRLALDAPARVSALSLICTSAAMDRAIWADRVVTVRTGGTSAIAEAAMARFLSPAFARSHPIVVDQLRSGLLAQTASGYAGAGAAIRDMDLADALPGIRQPTLVIGGDRDGSTPFAGHGARIAAAIPGARVAHVDAGHLAPVEAPGALAAILRGFLAPDPIVEGAAVALAEVGMANRRRVLGNAWVDRAHAARTPFTADFQAMIARTAWAGDMGPAGAGRSNAPSAGHQRHGRARPLGGIRSPRPCRAGGGRPGRGGAEGDAAPACGLCRRTGGEHRLCPRRGPARGAARSVKPTCRRTRAAGRRDCRPAPRPCCRRR